MFLQNGFFMTDPFNPYPYWNGAVLFEKSTPGTYYHTFQHKAKYGIICVGGGAGGFCAKLGITINKGAPDESTVSGLIGYSGASGGYGYLEREFNKGDVLTLIVGQGGNNYHSTSLYGSIWQASPSLDITGTEGTLSKVSLGSTPLLTCNPGAGGKWYFINPADPNTVSSSPSIGGTGTTTNGNNGLVTSPSNTSVDGGASLYNGYGAGGSAGYTGNDQSGTPWANNGTNGYIKIYAIMPS